MIHRVPISFVLLLIFTLPRVSKLKQALSFLFCGLLNSKNIQQVGNFNSWKNSGRLHEFLQEVLFMKRFQENLEKNSGKRFVLKKHDSTLTLPYNRI